MENIKRKKIIFGLFVGFFIVGIVFVFLYLNGIINFNTKVSNNNNVNDLKDKYYFYDIDIKLVDKNLIASVKDKEISINGIEGQVKTFLRGNDCGSYYYVLALTTNNRIFFSYFLYLNTVTNDNNYITFEEVKTNYKIVDIGKIQYAGFRTCNDHDFGVILDNGELRSLDIGLHDKITKIGDLNYNLIKKTTKYWPSIVLYTDNTVSQLLDNPFDGPIGDKLSYDGKNLLLSKYINISDGEKTGSYIISNQKLYKLIWNSEDSFTKIDKVELVNNFNIVNESLISGDVENDYYDNKQTDTIKFEDGTSIVIENIVYVYNNK